MDRHPEYKEYEAEIITTTRVKCKTKATNYDGARKLFQAGECVEIERLKTVRGVYFVKEKDALVCAHCPKALSVEDEFYTKDAEGDFVVRVCESCYTALQDEYLETPESD